MSTNSKRIKNGYVRIDHEKLKEYVNASNYKPADVSVIVGQSESWLRNVFSRGDAVNKEKLEQLAVLLGFEVADILPKPEPGKEPGPEQAGPYRAEKVLDCGKLTESIERLNCTCEAILEALTRAIDGPEPIPISKSERATELLRKAMVSTAGGGVKEKDYEKMLVQAGIGSSYKTEAMRNLDCRRFTANNGIAYIMKAKETR